MIKLCAFADQFVRCQQASLDACTVQAFQFDGFAAYVAPTNTFRAGYFSCDGHKPYWRMNAALQLLLWA